MSRQIVDHDAAIIRADANTISSPSDYDPLVEMAGKAQVVLIGEATHGTHEFYATRSAITQRLIDEQGFRAVAVEADWPDSFHVHRYVTGRADEIDPAGALGGFRRFPTWMWRNTVVVEFVEWLRAWNRSGRDLAGFYGMDLYSLHASIQAVLEYLDKNDPEAARRARYRYSCFDHFGTDPQNYGFATTVKGIEPCEDAVVQQLVDLRRKHAELISRDGRVAEEEFFSAEQNARLIVNAERYHRAMFRGRASSWNLRDEHMFETLNEIISHLDSGRAKVVVWAHNSHLGDARATEMSESGELNVGQRVRERFGRRAMLIGFTTYSGTVTAASNWDEPAECKRVRPALNDSYEKLFHAVAIPCFWLDLRQANAALLRETRLERAIGVIYRPETERLSHYFHARLAEQFDAVIHLDETHALEPLERNAEWERSELPETYPSAL